ncbi:RNA-binding protein 28-like [Diadema setosum]|uniref:RNA-binding protein 28-like n=1 Tax=Diadema setosum TaxID=31175 RepID=UPI003B3B558B
MATSSGHVGLTLFVRNLPYSTTKEDLENVFGEIGPLKKCFVVTDKGVKDKCRGFGYVTFALKDDAEKAVNSSKSLQGRKLKVSFADRKPKRDVHSAAKSEAGGMTEDDSSATKTRQPVKRKSEVIQKKEDHADSQGKEKEMQKKKKKKKKGDVEDEKEKRRCRLIVRNLPFKCSEEVLKSAFESFGQVNEVLLPVKGNSSKKLGFGFVQFQSLKNAAKAVKHMNGKEIMGRTVAVDWTLPREDYLKAMQEAKVHGSNTQDDEQDDNQEDEEMKEETDEDMSHSDDEGDGSADDSDMGDEDDEEEEEEEDNAEEEEEEETNDEEEEEESESYEEDDDEENEEGHDDGMSLGKRPHKTKEKQQPEDIQEGKTLFIRNVPYDCMDEDVTEVFSPFGDIEFCRVVLDQMTEHSRGTAFVKFKRKEDAEKCLQEGTALTLRGRLLAVSPAISRAEAVRLRMAEKEKAKEEQKDRRNLHLLREGMIRPGTKAAEGLPEVYLNKRLKVEEMKRDKLRNLNIFVSPTRLAIHNLPKSVDDKRLRELAKDAAGDKRSKVIEARIMRDRNQPNAKGVCKSLGFAFVEFTEHQHALAALHHLNNNQDLFGPAKRPIVGFSLENKRALEIKQRRKEKAMMKQDVLSERGKQEDTPQPRRPYSQQRILSQQKASQEAPAPANEAMVMPAGGRKKALPRHFGAKNRWRDRGRVAEEKRKSRMEKRKSLQRQVWSSMKDPVPAGALGVSKKELRKERRKNQSKKKHGRDVKEEKQFNAMVSKYKKKLMGTNTGMAGQRGSSKWFD